jgi:hypothetical protein
MIASARLDGVSGPDVQICADRVKHAVHMFKDNESPLYAGVDSGRPDSPILTLSGDFHTIGESPPAGEETKGPTN